MQLSQVILEEGPHEVSGGEELPLPVWREGGERGRGKEGGREERERGKEGGREERENSIAGTDTCSYTESDMDGAKDLWCPSTVRLLST